MPVRDHMFVMGQHALADRVQMLMRHPNALRANDRALVLHHRLGEDAVDAQLHDLHGPLVPASG